MKQIPASILTLLAGIVITLISLWVGQHHGLLPEQASEQAPLVDRFFSVMVTIGTALFLVVQGALIIFIIKFRRRSGDETDGLPIEGSIPLEILWTAVPAIIVIGLGIYSVDVYAQMGGFAPAGGMVAHHHTRPHHWFTPDAMAAALETDSSPMAAPVTPAKYGIGAAAGQTNSANLTVNVTGLQYAWLFNYPDSGIVSGELHVPLGQSVQLNFTAQDVIHSFWIPQFRLKQDVIPGENTELHFVATKVGTYPVVCAELCGGYHGSMRTQIIVHDPDEFTAWLQQNQVTSHA